MAPLPSLRTPAPTAWEVLTQAVTSALMTARTNLPKPPEELPAGFLAGAFFAGGLERVVLLVRVPEARVVVREAMFTRVSGTSDKARLRNSVIWPSPARHCALVWT